MPKTEVRKLANFGPEYVLVTTPSEIQTILWVVGRQGKDVGIRLLLCKVDVQAQETTEVWGLGAFYTWLHEAEFIKLWQRKARRARHWQRWQDRPILDLSRDLVRQEG